MATTHKSLFVIFLVTCLIITFIPITSQDNVMAAQTEVSDSDELIQAIEDSSTGDTIVINGQINISYTASKTILNNTAVITKGLNIVGKENTNAKIVGRLLINTSAAVSVSGVDFEFTSQAYGNPDPSNASTSDRGVIVVGKTGANLSLSNLNVTQNGYSDIITVGYLTGSGTNNVLNLNNVNLYGPSGNCQGITMRTENSEIHATNSTIQNSDAASTNNVLEFGITTQASGSVIDLDNCTITGKYAVKVGGPNGVVDVDNSNISGWSAISTVNNATGVDISVSDSTLTGIIRTASNTDDYGIITLQKGSSSGEITISKSTLQMDDRMGGISWMNGIHDSGNNNIINVSNSKIITGSDKSTGLDTAILSQAGDCQLNIDNNYWGENLDNLNDVITTAYYTSSDEYRIIPFPGLDTISYYTNSGMTDLNTITTYDTNSPITGSGFGIDAIGFIPPAKEGERTAAEVFISGTGISKGALQFKLSSADNSISVTRGIVIDGDEQTSTADLNTILFIDFIMPGNDIDDMVLELKRGDYLVRFVDWDGNVLGTDAVNHGESAEAPADPIRSGYKFDGWDTPFDNVTSELTVTATYTAADRPDPRFPDDPSDKPIDNPEKQANKTSNPVKITDNPTQAKVGDAMDLHTALYTMLACIILILASQFYLRRRNAVGDRI